MIQPPHGLKQIISTFGNVSDYIRDDGTLDPAWEIEKLGMVPLPFPLALSWDPNRAIKRFRSHILMVEPFTLVFEEIAKRGLQEHVYSFGGCFAYRAKRTSTRLSSHAWGISIDLNPAENEQGTPGQMNEEIIDIFTGKGFFYGGLWQGRNKDPMHWQFCTGY